MIAPTLSNKQSKYCNSIVNELQDYMLYKRTVDKAFNSMTHRTKELSELARVAAPYKKSEKVVLTTSGQLEEVLDVNAVSETHAISSSDTHVYRPHQPDSLFWCLYILLNGSESYETVNIENRPFMVENEEKIKMVDLVRANKQTIKQSKLGSIATIESDLSVAGKAISLSTFATICVLHGMEVLFIDKTNNTFCEVLSCAGTDISPTTHIVYKSASSLRFECEPNVLRETAQSKCSDFFQLHSINKPIKPISSFTTSDLIETCQHPSLRLSVKDNLGKPLSKRDLYNVLTSKLGMDEEQRRNDEGTTKGCQR
jgi:hypothetical protein